MDENNTMSDGMSGTGSDNAASTPASNNVVFVGSLAWATDGESLRRLFEEAGLKIAEDETKEDGYVKKAVVVVSDRETGRSRGYGFVTLESPEEAQKAVELLNEKELDGRNIRVQIKEERPRDDRRGGGGRFGGGSSGPRRSFGGGGDRGGRRSFGGGDRGGRRYGDNDMAA